MRARFVTVSRKCNDGHLVSWSRSFSDSPTASLNIKIAVGWFVPKNGSSGLRGYD